jgi:hypothetical protein
MYQSGKFEVIVTLFNSTPTAEPLAVDRTHTPLACCNPTMSFGFASASVEPSFLFQVPWNRVRAPEGEVLKGEQCLLCA